MSNELSLHQEFAAAGTGAPARVGGPALLMQATNGAAVELFGSNFPDESGSWDSLGTCTGFTPLEVTTSFAWIRVSVDKACTVRVSSAASPAAGAGGGGTAGDASAANQLTEIARLTSLVSQTDGVEASLTSIDGKLPALSGGRVPISDFDGTSMLTTIASRVGSTDDSAAASDSATASLIALMKRLLGKTQKALARTTMLSAVTATGAGSALADAGLPPSFSATVAGTGSVSATVLIQARNTASGEWITLGTITLSGTTSATDGFASLARYMEYRANLTAISGTGATVTVTMGS